jgi:hypothetical protein
MSRVGERGGGHALKHSLSRIWLYSALRNTRTVFMLRIVKDRSSLTETAPWKGFRDFRQFRQTNCGLNV